MRLFKEIHAIYFAMLLTVVALLFLIVIGMRSGGPAPKERLKDSGIFGEHSIVRIESFGAVQDSVSGSFFLGTGSVNGSSSSEFKIQFFWSPKPGEIIATALPSSQFRFIVDDGQDTPTIEFVFNDSWLNRKTYKDYGNRGKYPNLNEFLLSSDMALARVRISRSALEEEVYLPKIK